MLKSVTVTNYLRESLTLILDRPEKSGLIIESITGIGPENATVNIAEISTKDGGIFNSARKETRNIVMNLKFTETKDAPTIEDVRHKTYKYFPLKRKIFVSFLTDNHELCVDGYVESNEPDIFSKDEGCQISILCPDPYFRKIRPQRTFTSGSEPIFEFPFHNDLVPYDPSLPYDPDNPYDPNNPGYIDPDDPSLENPYEPEDGKLQETPGIFVQFGNIYDPPKYTNINGVHLDIGDVFPLSIYDYKSINFSFVTYVENDQDPSFAPELEISIDSKVIFSRYPTRLKTRYDCILNMSNGNYGGRMVVALPGVQVSKLEICKVTIEDVRIYGLEKIEKPEPEPDPELPEEKEDEEGYIYLRELNYKFIFSNMGVGSITIPVPAENVFPESILEYESIKMIFDITLLSGSFYGGGTPLTIEIANTTITGELPIKIFDEKVEQGTYQTTFNSNLISALDGSKQMDWTILLSGLGSDPRFEVNIKSIRGKGAIKNTKSINLLSLSNNLVSPMAIMTQTSDKKIISDNFLIDPGRPFYTFDQNDLRYNLQKSKGIIFGEINKYCLPHKIFYDGSIETGFVMTIEFAHDMVDDPWGETDNQAGYIVIRNPRYPKKTITVNLDKIKELLPKCEIYNLSHSRTINAQIQPLLDLSPSDPSNPSVPYNTVPIGQKGDLLIINTKKNKRGIYYAKPDCIYNSPSESGNVPTTRTVWGVLDEDTYQIHYYKNDEFNVLGALNKDVEWFQIGPGYNELRVYHTFHPERTFMSEDEKDLIHADHLEIEVLNDVLYEGV